MIPVYWINLTRRPDKRQHMLKIIEEYNSKNKTQIRNMRITPTKQIDYISCCIAHFDAIHTAWQDAVDWAVICEDDIENFNFLNSEYWEELTKIKDWHVTQLYYTCPILTEVLCESELKPMQRIVKGYMMGACCYLINRAGMEKFLNKMAVYNKNTHEYELNVNFLSNAKSEEFIFRYIDSRFLLLPIVNIINLGSDINTSIKNAADQNMENIKKIHEKINVYNLPLSRDIIPLEYHMHWFENKKDCYDKLKF